MFSTKFSFLSVECSMFLVIWFSDIHKIDISMYMSDVKYMPELLFPTENSKFLSNQRSRQAVNFDGKIYNGLLCFLNAKWATEEE